MSQIWGPHSKDHSRLPPLRDDGSISFIQDSTGFWGTGSGQRRWHISKAVAGWRLEFKDPGDEAFTFAGIHGSIALAKHEAGLVRGPG